MFQNEAINHNNSFSSTSSTNNNPLDALTPNTLGQISADSPGSIFDLMSYRDPSSSNDATEMLDFNDFLVASPSGITNSGNLTTPPLPPASQYSMPLGASHSNTASSSSVPRLDTSSSRDGSVPSSSRSSPASSKAASADYFVIPPDMTYGHPLVQHCLSGHSGYSMDALCQDMTIKATCKDVSHFRLASSWRRLFSKSSRL